MHRAGMRGDELRLKGMEEVRRAYLFRKGLSGARGVRDGNGIGEDAAEWRPPNGGVVRGRGGTHQCDGRDRQIPTGG